jgi:hypothetical protein
MPSGGESVRVTTEILDTSWFPPGAPREKEARLARLLLRRCVVTRALRNAQSFRRCNGTAARSCRLAFLERHVDRLFSAIADQLDGDRPRGLA